MKNTKNKPPKEKRYYCDAKYSSRDFAKERLEIGEYENCVFSNCRFSNLSFFVFINCGFLNCELSNVKLNSTVFRDVKFTKCKLMGVQFSNCNELLLSMELDGSQLNLASFYKLKLRKMMFTKCELIESDFTGADLSGSVFTECDFNKAIFENTNLSSCDFSTALNYSIDPEKNKITKAKFSILGLRGLLSKYDIIIE